jgi:[NiFe]-hydrogenase assembly, chaperone, HybE
MICPDTLSAGLDAAFTRIQRERMADTLLLNPVLEVQAVGFGVREDYCPGVLPSVRPRQAARAVDAAGYGPQVT